MAYQIRTYGDPVLKTKAAEVADIDGKIARLVDDMFDTLYESESGIALAAPQIGVQKQIFVWDVDDEAKAIINPQIVESSGEWVYDEGCLSIPGLYVEMLRPNTVLVRGYTVDGDEVEIEADELIGRLFQHEIDHLHGVLMFDRMTPDQRKEAMKEYRRIQEEPSTDASHASPSTDVTRAAPPRRLAYLGTPQMAVPPLRALVAAGFEVALVVTRGDKRRGRGSQLMPSPVKAAAIEMGVHVAHEVDDVIAAGADLGVVVAFGQLIRPHVLAAVPMVNLHFSLLPRWRGAAPVERALLAGDAETGVCLMQLEEGLDTGPVYRTERVPIGATTTADDLRTELVEVGTRILIEELRAGLDVPRPQTGEPTYAAKIRPDELRIDWTRPPADVHRLIRLGGSWTTLHGKRLKIAAAEVVGRRAEPAADRRPCRRDSSARRSTGRQGADELRSLRSRSSLGRDRAGWWNQRLTPDV